MIPGQRRRPPTIPAPQAPSKGGRFVETSQRNIPIGNAKGQGIGGQDNQTPRQKPSAGEVKSRLTAKSRDTLDIHNKKSGHEQEKDGPLIGQIVKKLQPQTVPKSPNQQIATNLALGKVGKDDKTSQQGIQIEQPQIPTIVRQVNEMPPKRPSTNQVAGTQDRSIVKGAEMSQVTSNTEKSLPQTRLQGIVVNTRQQSPDEVPAKHVGPPPVTTSKNDKSVLDISVNLAEHSLQRSDVEAKQSTPIPDEGRLGKDSSIQHTETTNQKALTKEKPSETSRRTELQKAEPNIKAVGKSDARSDSEAKQSIPIPDEGILGKDSSIQHAENTNQEALAKGKPPDTPDTAEIQEAEPNIKAVGKFDASSNLEQEIQKAATVGSDPQILRKKFSEILHADDEKAFLDIDFDLKTVEMLDPMSRETPVSKEVNDQYIQAVVEIAQTISPSSPFEGRRRLFALVAQQEADLIDSRWKMGITNLTPQSNENKGTNNENSKSGTKKPKIKSSERLLNLLENYEIGKPWEVFYANTREKESDLRSEMMMLSEQDQVKFLRFSHSVELDWHREAKYYNERLNLEVDQRKKEKTPAQRYFTEDDLKTLLKQGLSIPDVLELEFALDLTTGILDAKDAIKHRYMAESMIHYMTTSQFRTLKRFENDLDIRHLPLSNIEGRWLESPTRMLFGHPKFGRALQIRLKVCARGRLKDADKVPYSGWIEHQKNIDFELDLRPDPQPDAQRDAVKLSVGEILAATHYGIPLQDLVDVKLALKSNKKSKTKRDEAIFLILTKEIDPSALFKDYRTAVSPAVSNGKSPAQLGLEGFQAYYEFLGQKCPFDHLSELIKSS
ncbi:hypothetical protein CROQUDRAFT_86161 [Cronartium quercuum f. sp. fusiforme G11]|uniref:Uncharacterized protein n=1 Tax=Cronartium quercuum f. sp. fusiforme G11 TaxID=708437 RepID=A0A9P6NYR6_9BASI|nr:hypothetical protein CROQUDRAFT_86161 [Cronartium quercuum f. sp. fusiforme G11]